MLFFATKAREAGSQRPRPGQAHAERGRAPRTTRARTDDGEAHDSRRDQCRAGDEHHDPRLAESGCARERLLVREPRARTAGLLASSVTASEQPGTDARDADARPEQP